jgi:membrane protein DedA with SNARE-associated domain
VQAAERWFDRHGDATVFFTRMMPIIRTFISVPAGAAKMPLLRFSVLTFLGCLPWIFGLTFIGEQVGANWTDWKDSLKYVDYAVVALVAAAIVLIVLRGRRRRGAAKPAADAGAG